MAIAIDTKAYAKLVAEVKKDLKAGEGKVTRSETALSNASGVPMSQIGKGIYRAEVEADPSLSFANLTGDKMSARIVKERDGNMRWPRIAVRSGLSVSKVQEIFEAKSGRSAAESYTGRGRKPGSYNGNGSTSGVKTTTRGRGTKAKTATAKATGTRGTSGRRTRSSGTKTKTAPASRTGRRGTRAQAAADPK